MSGFAKKGEQNFEKIWVKKFLGEGWFSCLNEPRFSSSTTRVYEEEKTIKGMRNPRQNKPVAEPSPAAWTVCLPAWRAKIMGGRKLRAAACTELSKNRKDEFDTAREGPH